MVSGNRQTRGSGRIWCFQNSEEEWKYLLPCTELSPVWQIGYQQLINFSSYILAIVACLYVIYIKPDLPSFPKRVKSNNVGFTELCNIPFSCRGQNKHSVMSVPFPLRASKLEFIILFHNIQTFVLKWKNSSFDAFLAVPNGLIKESFETLKILSVHQDFLKL